MSKRLRQPNKQTPEQAARVSAIIENVRRFRAHTLNLSSQNLTELPASISQLTQLRVLRLDNNELTHLPEFLGQLTQLQYLHVSNNKLTALPESLCQLTQLRGMFLDSNELTHLPEFLGQMSRLLRLHIDNNKLTALPESLCELTRLKTLSVDNNELTHLPKFLGQLTRLRNLYLYNNKLTALPESLRNLSSLEGLFLHRNEQLNLPAEVLGATWEEVRALTGKRAKPSEILEYYFRVREGEPRPLNEAKLILVGRGAVGKTSLVNRLVHKRFEGDEKKTEGIQITEWGFKLNGREDVRLNVWDFGGQEIMHATHQFFLTQRSLYLLVLNGREGGEDTDAEYWLKLIESFGGESPVIVVLNKIGEHPFDVNRRALQGKYPVREFVKTDCADGTGIEELRRVIERETDRLEHLRDAFPAGWFAIKEHLARMRKNYVSFEEYREFCAEHGERDGKAQESLAGYLHNLGIVLNYKDDPRLQEMHVLNPHWVTNGIYKILNSDKLERQKGVIHLNELSEILDASEYPSGMRRFILDLMKKFDLCFSFPGDDSRYLIPELLDKQEPAETAEFEARAFLNFQYHYPILPEGLLPRFIVRTHALSEGLARWRSGVILKFENNRALVKADVQERTVFISVSGEVAGRRRLLAVIRSDFERIHRDIRNMHPQEMIPLPNYPKAIVSYQELLVMEQSGLKKLPKVVGNRVVELDVDELLNGVDLEGMRDRREKRMYGQRQAARLFYSYSHRDESLRNKLQTHLKILQRQGLIESWHDRDIEAGEDWRQKIDENLEQADIILLLVSDDFIASDYCYEKELKRALERHESGEARVIPVIVRDVNWSKASFAKLTALPKDGKAVTTWQNEDSAWRNVSEEIQKVAEGLQKKFGRIG